MNLSVLLSVPRSLYYNIKCLPFSQAVKLPILIGNNVKICGSLHRGSFVIDTTDVHRGMITLGIYKGSFAMGTAMNSLLRLSSDAKIVFHGGCGICSGMKIDVSRSGELHIGNKVSINSGAIISSNTVVNIGDGVRTGWNITIIDWDGHDMIDINSKTIVNSPKPINIGERCWLGTKSTILKGVSLAHHCVIPYGSIITKSCDEPVSTFGGSPNRVLGTGKVRTDMCDGL